MKKGAKRSPLTKDDLLKQQEREKNKTLIKERFYPAVVEATISVDEAGQLMNAVAAMIMEEAMETLRVKKMSEIKKRIVHRLCPNDERVLQIEKLMTVFDDMTLFNARGHFESMKQVIEQMKMDYFRSKKLNSMSPDWERYLQK